MDYRDSAKSAFATAPVAPIPMDHPFAKAMIFIYVMQYLCVTQLMPNGTTLAI
jgi:hypothetical protein